VDRGRLRPATKSDGVVENGDKTLANRLTEVCNLGLQRKSLILDIQVMVN